jgi:DNA-binding transcriptional LysR family regulator
MRKAAAVLNTNQPSVSRTISGLEDLFGVSLLDRLPHGVALTAYGRAVLQGSMAIFDDLGQTLRMVDHLADPDGGDLRIGCIPPLAPSFVSATIDRFARHRPRVVFDLTTDLVETLHARLIERSLDLVFAARIGPFVCPEINFEPLFDNECVIAAGLDNPWARRRKIELSDLVDERWTMPPPDRMIGSIFLEVFRANGLDYPHVSVLTSQIDVRISLLLTGRYLSMFNPITLQLPRKSVPLKVLPINFQFRAAPMGIMTLPTRSLTPVAQHFIECAREMAQEMTTR